MIMSSNVCVSLSITLILSVIFRNHFTLDVAFRWPRCHFDEINSENFFLWRFENKELVFSRWTRTQIHILLLLFFSWALTMECVCSRISKQPNDQTMPQKNQWKINEHQCKTKQNTFALNKLPIFYPHAEPHIIESYNTPHHTTLTYQCDLYTTNQMFMQFTVCVFFFSLGMDFMLAFISLLVLHTQYAVRVCHSHSNIGFACAYKWVIKFVQSYR